MILSSNVVTSLLKATDKAIPELGDTDLRVPPILLHEVEPRLPLDVLTNNSTPQSSSVITAPFRDIGAADPGGIDPVMVLSPGLWTLEWNLWGSANNYKIRALAINFSFNTYTLPIDGVSTWNYYFRTQGKKTFLVRDEVTIEIEYGATAAGETVNYNSSFVATRHL